MVKDWVGLARRVGLGGLAAGLLSGAAQNAQAKGMNPIHRPTHLTCPPGSFPSGDKCVGRITVIKGRRG